MGSPAAGEGLGLSAADRAALTAGEARVFLRASLPLPVAPETAWRIWSVVEDWPRWDRGCSRDARWLAGAPWTVGARLRVGRWPGRFECELVVVDPPHQVTWVGSFAGLRGRHTFGFLPHPRGCLMVSEETFSGRGAGVLGPVIRWAWSRQMGAFREWAMARISSYGWRDAQPADPSGLVARLDVAHPLEGEPRP